jgi:hypothetical protein
MFFVTVRHWQYYDWGTWVIVSQNQLTLPASPSARYCTVFKMLGCWMIKQRVAHNITNGRSARITVKPIVNCSILFYSTVSHSTSLTPLQTPEISPVTMRQKTMHLILNAIFF